MADDRLPVAINAAKAAGALLVENFSQPGFADVAYKDPQNVVTASDKASEQVIIQMITQAFPQDSIFSEEMGMEDKASQYLWIIDPLDGTTNFSRNIAYFDVSIGLLKDNEPMLGVVFEPLTGDLYSAVLGQGAILNDKPIHVNQSDDLGKAVVSLERGSTKEQKIRFGKIISEMIETVRSVRDFGVGPIGLAYVGAGKFDAFTSNGCNRHDFAAGALIAREAGALVTDFLGKPLDWSLAVSDVLAANPKMHSKLLPLLHKY